MEDMILVEGIVTKRGGTETLSALNRCSSKSTARWVPWRKPGRCDRKKEHKYRQKREVGRYALGLQYPVGLGCSMEGCCAQAAVWREVV